MTTTPAAHPACDKLIAIDMVLHCPKCGMQHVDAPDKPSDASPVLYADAWDNPPHRSHLCHGCGHIWRPADVATNGVAAVKTTGKNDSPIIAPGQPEVADEEFEVRADGVRVRKDRWQTGIRRIVALLWGNRHEFEVDEVVEAVRKLIPAPHTDDEALCNAILSPAPGQPGYVTRTICYPEPLKVMPEKGQRHFWLDSEGVQESTWAGGCYDLDLFNRGLCYPATPKGEAHAREAWNARFGGERG